MNLPDDFRDLLLRLADAGAEFDEAIEAHDSFELEGRRSPVIGLAALLKNKRATGRGQDLIDLEALTAARTLDE